MDRRRKSVGRNPAIKRRATQRRYPENIPKSKEGRRHERAIANFRICTQGVFQADVSKFGLHSMCPV